MLRGFQTRVGSGLRSGNQKLAEDLPVHLSKVISVKLNRLYFPIGQDPTLPMCVHKYILNVNTAGFLGVYLIWILTGMYLCSSRPVCITCLRVLGLAHICCLCLSDVFRHPTQIPARHQEPLLVRGILRERVFRSIQDKFVRALLEALSHGVPASEEHFSRTFDPPRRKSIPHAVSSLFLYHRSAKVWHDGPVRQTEAAP